MRRTFWHCLMFTLALVPLLIADAPLSGQQAGGQQPRQGQPGAQEASPPAPAQPTESEIEGAPVEPPPQRRRRRDEAKLALGDQEVVVQFGLIEEEDSPDLALLRGIKDGQVLRFTRCAATKIKTGAALRFGDVVLEAGNVAANYPGVYSLWLKKVGDGWHLIFNQKPDVWGTQHDPEFDVAEIPITTGPREGDETKLTVELRERGTGGLLRIAFGPRQWTAEFGLVQ